MNEGNPAATLDTLHGDLGALHGDVRALRGDVTAGFADVKATLIAGFRSLPSRESSNEMVRLLREGNRLQDERFTPLDLRVREQHLESQQLLHAMIEGQRVLTEGQRVLTEGQRLLIESQRALSADIKALIARLDALIRGRGNGEPTA